MSFLRLDADAMAEATAAMPDHIAAALSEPPGLPGGLSGERPSLVVVAGMGGSGVAGRVLEVLAAGSSPVPVLCAGGYLLPAFAGPGSLVVAVSFSGETEETLEVAAAALERGAALVAITSGGELARLAEGAGAPISRLPAGISRPRAAVAAMTAPLLLLAGELGLFPGARSSLESCVSQLHKR
ncbi:MAG: SIS domain-containing protein, partial [Acidimicrobiales bacterium]